MRILVTGSSGLVGVPLTAALRGHGSEVVEYDLRPPPGVSASGGFSPRDLRDASQLAKAVEGVDGVVHLAAVSRCAPAESDPELAQAINVGGTEAVLEALRAARRPAWMILASSREVYGEVSSIPVDESFPVRPKAVYGRTKAGAEAAVVRSHADDHRAAVILRLTNLYGSPWDYSDRVIPAFVSRARKDLPLEVRGPEQVLDFLDVRDGVRAILAAIELARGAPRTLETLNVASGNACTLRRLAEQVVEVTHSNSPIQTTAAASWTPSKFVADVSRARSVLGWSPSISLPDGIRDLSDRFASIPDR